MTEVLLPTIGKRGVPSRGFQFALMASLRVALVCATVAGPSRAILGDDAVSPIATFDVGEHCGETHPIQAISFPFTADEGRLDADAFMMRAQGTTIPCQLTDVERWPDSQTVKSANAWVVTGLRPFEQKRFEIIASEAAAHEATVTNGDVAVREGDGVAEMCTALCGFRFPVGRTTFDPPIQASDVPGPVKAYRIADGTWTGGSAMYGEKRISGFEADVVERGPIVGELRLRYTYEDGTVMTLHVRLAWGSSQARWSMDVTPVDLAKVTREVTEAPSKRDASEDPALNGWRLTIGSNDTPLGLRVMPEFGENRWGKHEWVDGRWRSDPVHVDPSREAPGLLLQLVPWNDWWDSSTTTTLTLQAPEGVPAFSMSAEDAGVWVEPAALGTWAPWGNRRMRDKWLPVLRDRSGSVFVQISLASGSRRWRCGVPDAGPKQELDRLKGLVLAWAEERNSHPRLYMDSQTLDAARRRRIDEVRVRELVASAGEPQPEPHHSDAAALGAWLLTGDRRIADRVRLVPRLENHLALDGEFDRMRGTYLLCALYDGVLGSDLLRDNARRGVRARMARLAYKLADANTWSMERGYCSGNLNMSVAHVLNQGIVGCVLRDHPQALEWIGAGLGMLERSLATTVGPDGEWPESPANYAHVSVSALLPLAIAARNAGFDDYVADSRMKKLMLFISKHYTPPDPRRMSDGAVGVSVLPPVSRGGARGRNGLPGVMATAMASADPKFAAIQQWVWRRAGFPRNIPESRLGGWEQVYLDESLPATNPAWSLDVFRQSGAILRHAFGTRDEWWTYFMASTIDGYPSESGGVPLVFAKGVPIIARFSGGYAEREELFLNRVLPARPRGDDDFRRQHFLHEGKPALVAWSAIPSVEYVEGKFTIGAPRFVSHEATAHDRMQPLPEWPSSPTASEGDLVWRRRVMLVKDEASADASLFVRDDVTGDRPTIWQMWLVSNGVRPLDQTASVSPNQIRRPIATVESGPISLPGMRFLATGQFDVDTQIFVAQPSESTCSTLRWGRPYDYSPLAGIREDMDLLHLQRPDDGPYFVAFHPQRRGEQPARFESLADGAVIRGDHGSRIDYVLLADAISDVAADGIRFKGSAAVFRSEKDGPTVAFCQPGGVQFAHRFIASEEPRVVELVTSAPATFIVRTGRIVVRCASGHAGTGVRVKVPGSWKALAGPPGLTSRDEGTEGIRIQISEGVNQVVVQESL